MRLGRYDRAFAAWDTIDDRALIPKVQASRGAALRELGLHDWAEDVDRRGLEIARSAEDIASLRVGLVADAVGCGDATTAETRLAVASAAVADVAAGREADRQFRRLGWVRLEIALLTGGQTDVALPVRHPSGRLVVPAVYVGAGRHHLAKGLMFSGVVHGDRRALDVAVRIAWPGLRWAIHLARADLGAPGSLASARASWAMITVPTELKALVGAGPVGLRAG